eukprot:CAMPEP_0202980748 /NCGR_PEP_ID=MMETSP1396-20130829/86608_1 /ASSEMBLY_ACC=CAM_ASM_000872 /TAXON_ID= /ORGANISM="Pseudokeronopsis sp., Strain Brazil" /LENGTH=133 /DNA_ID=CAMNT_0049720905 /DNA_START=5 /DNA_END=406 /DNA_ORIENTATION=+
MREKRKGQQKYKYVNRISEILDDEYECQELQREAKAIKKNRIKNALQKPNSTRQKSREQTEKSSRREEEGQSSSKRGAKTEFELRHEKVLQKKWMIEHFNYKKNIFYLHEQGIIQDYRQKALKDAVALRKRKD